MTEQEILEYNKRCAEFLGWKVGGMVNLELWYEKDNRMGEQTKDLKFYSDWNWIMRVVENILDVCLNLDSMEMYYNITDAIPEKHKAVQAINQFLIWYNERK